MQLFFKGTVSETTDNFFEGEIGARYLSMTFKYQNKIEGNELVPIEGYFDVEFDGDDTVITVNEVFYLKEDETPVRLSNLDISFQAIEKYLQKHVNVDLSDYLVDRSNIARYGRI